MNRGVEGRNLFEDSSDYVRFIHNLYEFNDTKVAAASDRRLGHDVGSTRPYIRERIVNIHGWCLMRNHYHLLLSERIENGIPLFLRKINTGYANYFNTRYTRKGTLFQGRTKKVVIERDAHFLYILHYIHLNPLDYLDGSSDWRYRSKGSIQNAKESLKYLETYRWSSLLDYLGQKNFPSLLSKNLFEKALGSYPRELTAYLQDAEDDNAAPDTWLE
ncbi:MAG: transposase [Candidatus Pacebacteria bacterium]|nr:transposase [Candidatus Paceibacterota bacterium]